MTPTMPRSFATLLLTLVLIGGTVALAGPARADRWTYDDAAGDVSRLVETPTSLSVEAVPEQANGDITQVVIDHRRKRIGVDIVLRAPLAGPFIVSVGLRTPGHRFQLSWMRMPGTGMGGLDLVSFDAHRKDLSVRCAGLKRTLAADRTAIRLSVPRSCLDRPRWLRASVSLNTIALRTGESHEDDGLRTGRTLMGEFGKSPKIRR